MPQNDLHLHSSKTLLIKLPIITHLAKNMNFLTHKTVMVTLVMLIMTRGLAEQANGQICGSTFFSALVQLIPCRAAVAPFSPIPPSDACCSAIRSLGQPCLCVLVNGPPISGVDRNMAMQLPDKCTSNFQPCGMRK